MRYIDTIENKNIPNSVNVVIEIVAGSSAIKYEMDEISGLLRVDRIIPTNLRYPCNYGFAPHTLSGDGDACDILIITHEPLLSGSVIECRPVGVLKLEDQSGRDWKILCIPNYNISNDYDSINDIEDIKKEKLDEIKYFYDNYKNNEKGKWVKIEGWGSKEEAENELIQGSSSII